MKTTKITLTLLTIITVVTLLFTTIFSVSAENAPQQGATDVPSESVTDFVDPTEAPTSAPTSIPLDPSTPYITSSSNTRTGIKLTWNAVAIAGKYNVYIKINSDWKKLGDTKSTSFTYTKARNNTSYTFTVRGTSANGKKFVTPYDPVGYTTTYYTAPQLTKVENTTEGVKVSWNAVDGIDEYRVFVKRSGASNWTNKGVVNTTNYTHTSGVSGRKYVYTVRCYKEGQLVSSFDPTGKTITYVAAPKVTKLENTRTGVKLTWNKVGGAYKYRVFMKTSSGWKKLGDTKSTTFTHTTTSNNTDYTYTVRCCNSQSKYISAYNKEGYTTTYYTAPQLESVKNTTEGVKVSWNAVEGIDEYRVYVKTPGSSWTKAADVTGTTFTHKAAESGTKYTYTVKCRKDNNSVSSFDSKGKSVTYIAAPVIDSVVLNSNNSVTLTWDKVTGAYQYRVFLKQDSGWKGVAYTKGNTYTIKNLQSNTNYTYTVRCCNADKNYISSYVSSGCTFARDYIVEQEAYTEENLLYTQVTRAICNKCGADISGDANGKVGDLDPNYKDSSRKWYHYEIERCSTAWHTETKWYNKVENRLATIEESDAANNPYLYNESHQDKLERRYKYSAVCAQSDCINYATTIATTTTLSIDAGVRAELQEILDNHYNENHPSDYSHQGQISCQQQVWQIIKHPEIGHYELVVK